MELSGQILCAVFSILTIFCIVAIYSIIKSGLILKAELEKAKKTQEVCITGDYCKKTKLN
jgi:hypothetical protein